MAVMLNTSVGDLVIDLFTDQCPLATKNFLKLCKIKYYNHCIFHLVQKDFIVQTGDPTGTGSGGDSIYKLLYGDQARFFDDEIHPQLKHDKVGIVAMASAGENANASQVFSVVKGGHPGTEAYQPSASVLADLAKYKDLRLWRAELDYLDGKHTVFGEVGEGLETLMRINGAFVDEKERPYKNIWIKHTTVLDDPFDDPAGLADLIPDKSPAEASGGGARSGEAGVRGRAGGRKPLTVLPLGTRVGQSDGMCASMRSNPARRDVLRLGNLWRMGVLWTLCLIYSHICLFFHRLRASGSHNSKPLQRAVLHLKPACVVTGASSGIGRATATALARQGFHVILASRSLERLWEVQAEIEAQGIGATCQALELNLCSVPSILKFSKIVAELFGGDDPPGKLQLLVNNAGCLATSQRWTEDGFDFMMASNYLGPYILTCQLLPVLQRSTPRARIVNVVSFTHRAVRGLETDELQFAQASLEKLGTTEWYHLARIYETSKLYLTLFSYELHRRLSCNTENLSSVSIIAADPGAVSTNILREVPKWLAQLSRVVLSLLGLLELPTAGASAVLAAATAPWDVSGRYFFGAQGLSCKSSSISYDKFLSERLWDATESVCKEVISKYTM